MGSGYASYDELDFQECNKFFDVPMVKVDSKESLQGLGKLVFDYDNEDVIIEKWPVHPQNKRQLMEGSGLGGGTAEGMFRFQWNMDFLHAQNEAVGGFYTVGKRIGEYVVTREMNYHGDGGQVVYPTDNTPFVLLLAPPGDDIQLSDITAFLCDGSFGVQILPNVWHQPVFPLYDSTFKNKQGAVHACIGFDSVKEYETWIRFKM